MIKFFGYFFLIILLYAANAGFLQNFIIYGAGSVNLLFLLTISLALLSDDLGFLPVALFSGLILDFSTGVFFGSFSLAFAFAGTLLYLIAREVVAVENNWKYLPGILLLSQLFVYVWVYFYNLLAARMGAAYAALPFLALPRHFVWEFFYNLLFFYFVWKLAGLPARLQAKFSGKTNPA